MIFLNTLSKLLAPICIIGSFNSAISAYALGGDVKKLPEISCKASASPSKREMSTKESQQISSTISEVESLERQGYHEQAALLYSKVQIAVGNVEGLCSVNSGRVKIVYGSKLYRAFRFEEAEKQIRDGLKILQLHNMVTKETCNEYTGGMLFLFEIYKNKFEQSAYISDISNGASLLGKCQDLQPDATTPKLFKIFLSLSSAIFWGYEHDETADLRKQREELAFDALNKAYSVVSGKPTEEQLASLFLKEGYFKYKMAAFAEKQQRFKLLQSAKESTTLAMKTHEKLENLEKSLDSAKQLAYILESLQEFSDAYNIYKSLIAQATNKPQLAEDVNENFTLLTGYTFFTKNWKNKKHFSKALLTLRQWEKATLINILPLLTVHERIKYLSLFYQSEGVAARGFAAGLLSAEEYLDTFLQLRYSLIDSELISLKHSKNNSNSTPKQIPTLKNQMEATKIDYTNSIRQGLGKHELLIQFIEASPGGYNTLTSTNEIETKTQAFVVKGNTENNSLTHFKTCESELCFRLITDALKSSSEGLSDSLRKWSILLDKLFPPSLVREIQNSEIIYIGLDGILQRVPIAIIRRYLESKGLQKHRFVALQSLNDIGRHERTISPSKSTVFYAPDFGENISCHINSKCQQKWNNLAYSIREGEVVSEILSGLKVFGKNATKSSMLDFKSPRILHISSHAGFDESANVERISYSREFNERKELDNLYNLFIVASGANVLPADLTIATYKDIAKWKLRGTALVVISACETGLGSSLRGYGLFGMHRILSSVGAESTLLSMWKVDDEATSVLMSMFYKNLKEGYTLDRALAKAQDKMASDPKLEMRGWNHPYYWAGWQLAGKMQPIYKK